VSRIARIAGSVASISPLHWQALDHQGNPFLSQAFLQALETSGSVSEAAGWQPHHLCLYEGPQLVGFAPTYLKSHSHGEFVFDWAWADAYLRHGRKYYPKLLTAVPYSPVTGPRLLVQAGHPQAAAIGRELAQLARSQCEELDLSSWHCNFVDAGGSGVLRQEPLLARSDWQFHWFNHGYASFDDFLATLRSKKRKNILRDRRLVRDAGIRFVRKTGQQLSAADLDFAFACYQQTFLEHGNHPALNRAFFAALASQAPESLLVVLAMRGEKAVAMSLFLVGGGRLYGRYWGCLEQVPGLHFEAAYHQGIEYCIEHGLHAFEPGAQGEHKISRGFTPVRTNSFHLVRDPVFRAAIADFLQRERAWMEDYRQQLTVHLPFRAEDQQ
jgi:predicted N-acyltransferase